MRTTSKDVEKKRVVTTASASARSNPMPSIEWIERAEDRTRFHPVQYKAAIDRLARRASAPPSALFSTSRRLHHSHDHSHRRLHREWHAREPFRVTLRVSAQHRALRLLRKIHEFGEEVSVDHLRRGRRELASRPRARRRLRATKPRARGPRPARACACDAPKTGARRRCVSILACTSRSVAQSSAEISRISAAPPSLVPMITAGPKVASDASNVVGSACFVFETVVVLVIVIVIAVGIARIVNDAATTNLRSGDDGPGAQPVPPVEPSRPSPMPPHPRPSRVLVFVSAIAGRSGSEG